MKHQTGFAVIASLVLVSVSACDAGEASVSTESESIAATPLPVTVALPRVADIYATYDMTAKLAADSEAAVIARAAGQIVEILVEEGDSVTAGQILARLDGERARLQMLQAQANLEKASRNFERQVNLRERGLVSAASLEGLKYDVDALKATYELKKLDYEYTSIRAPISGVIASRNIKQGAHVKINDAPFHIANTTLLVAYLRIPQTELGKFSAGDEATVRVDAMPGTTFRATIARVSPTVDSRNGTFRATAYMKNRTRELVPGMFGRFSIAYDKHSNALLVPKAAIISEDNENVVYVVENGAAIRRTVTLGIESVDMIEVLDGLEGSETVIIAGHTGLRDGSKVIADNRTENVSAG
jgi:membrane fusion protein (multidrug efflux system)